MAEITTGFPTPQDDTNPENVAPVEKVEVKNNVDGE